MTGDVISDVISDVIGLWSTLREHTVTSCIEIRAAMIPVDADVGERFLLTSGFYSNQVFLCMATLKPSQAFMYVDVPTGLKSRAFKTGFLR